MKTQILLALLLELLLAHLTFTLSGNGTSSLLPVSSQKRSSYGEACSRLTKCDRGAWLKCHSGTCQCSKPEEMTYDEQTGKCVTQIGERCRVALQQSPDDDDSFIFEVTPCISNANCSSEGICACKSNFYENSNGSCSTALSYLEPCIAGGEVQCSTYQGLHCQAGRCACEEIESVFYYVTNPTHQDENDHSLEPQCVGLPKHPCINSKCVQNAKCLGNLCTCKTGFYPELNGTCVPQFEPMSPCNKDAQCLHKGGQPFGCVGGVCDCSLPDSTYAASEISAHNRDDWSFSEFQGFSTRTHSIRCVGLVDTKCIDRRCAPNAYCSYNSRLVENYFDADGKLMNLTEDEKHAGTCKCRSGSWKTKYRTCGTSYTSNCERSRDCIDGLICKSASCLCPYEYIQYYHSSVHSCISRIGGPCGRSVNATCSRNAECRELELKEVSQGEVDVGHCVCKSGYVENEGYYEDNCVKGYGTPCTAKSECDQVAELDCIDGRCGCKTFSEYDGNLRKCLGLVGSKCDPKELYQCSNNSHCRDPRNKRITSGSCTCDEGFQETRNFTCDAIATKIVQLDL